MELERKIAASIHTLPAIEGPIPVTQVSHPYSAMAFSRCRMNLAAYGYVEEEYFLSGTANVYDLDENGRLYIKHEAVAYKNRILVRRPKDIRNYSGRVLMDILNASSGYDIEDGWDRFHNYCLDSGHAYVGVTSKPLCVQALKNFDFARYRSLSWPSAEPVPQPAGKYGFGSIEGTEEGLVWDILSQTANLLRCGGKQNCLGGYSVSYLNLSGQSQSGMYLNTYTSCFHRYLKTKDGRKLFDTYLNIVGVASRRPLCQTPFMAQAARLPGPVMEKVDSPYILISSEGDMFLFRGMQGLSWPEDSDAPDNKIRYYEIPGTPHTNIICKVLNSYEETDKTGVIRPPIAPETVEGLNDTPLEYYVCGILELLYKWWAFGTAPPKATRFSRDPEGNLVRDAHGNVIGGLRTPFVDIPAASYLGCSTKFEQGAMCGEKNPFSFEKMTALYGSLEAYLTAFSAYVKGQVEEGFILPADARRMIQWAERTAARCR